MEGSIGVQTSAGSSSPWRSGSPSKPRKPREAEGTLQPVVNALCYAFGPVLRRSKSDPSEGKLGIAPPSYAKMCVRSAKMIEQLCKELSEYWYRLAQYNERSSGSSWKRHERQMREDAAHELMAAVLRLPQPQREVVILRAMGCNWREMQRRLPDRVQFSMLDDWRTALRTLDAQCNDLVRTIG